MLCLARSIWHGQTGQNEPACICQKHAEEAQIKNTYKHRNIGYRAYGSLRHAVHGSIRFTGRYLIRIIRAWRGEESFIRQMLGQAGVRIPQRYVLHVRQTTTSAENICSLRLSLCSTFVSLEIRPDMDW